jgi:uncharacterized protein (TIGR02145 family)
MKSNLTKFALSAALVLAITLTLSCSGDDGDEGGGGSCSLETLDGVWEVEGQKLTINGSTGTVSGDQVYKELKSTGNLTWSGKEKSNIEEVNGVIVSFDWTDVQLTMSADGQTLTAISDDGETVTLKRKCNNQSGGGSSSPSGGKGGTFKDTRDGKTYKTVKIGNQTWMAENLNYDVPGNDTDVCYDNDPAKCTKYGRLYNWETAMIACPNGWLLPDTTEWQTLVDLAGGDETAGKYLKSKSGWENDHNGEDTFGFSALPGGYSDGLGFSNVSSWGYWWTATSTYDGYNAISRLMGTFDPVRGYNDNKGILRSVRCIQN